MIERRKFLLLGGSGGGGGIADAPVDGKKYGRKNAAWEEITDTYIDGEVQYYTDLPVVIGTPPIGSAYVVREASGVWFLTRRPAGIWVRLANVGALTDWTYAGTFPDVFDDSIFTIYNNAAPTKLVKFSASAVTAGATRTLSSPDANGTLALVGDAPTAHALSHQNGGGDAIKIDDLAAGDDNTDLNASTTKHGLSPKATAPGAGLRNVLGIDNGETAHSDKALFDATTPADLGVAAAGTAMAAARRDHVHKIPTLSNLGIGNVTNDAQTKASIVPNTAPAAGEILVGNAGGTAYAKQAVSGDATLGPTGALTITNSRAQVALIAAIWA